MRRLLKQAAFAICVLAITVYTLLKQFNWRPDQHAFSYIFTNYEHGFIRRGLLGTLALPFIRSVSNETFLVAYQYWSVGVLAVTVGLILVESWLAWARSLNPLVPMAIVVFFSSQFVSLLGFTTGWLDHFSIISAIAAMMLIRANRPMVAALVCVVAILTHEMFLLFGLPVVLFQSYLKEAGVKKSTLLTAIACLGAYLVVTHTVPSSEFERVFKSVPFMDAHEKFFYLVALSSVDSSLVHSQISAIRENLPRYLYLFLLPLPATMFPFIVGTYSIKSRAVGMLPRFATLTFAGTCFIAMTIILANYDVLRVFSLSNLQAYLAFLLVVRTAPARSLNGRHAAVFGVIVAIILAMQLLMKFDFYV